MRRLHYIATAIAVAALVSFMTPDSDAGGKKVDHPRLRAALHELREARGELKDARDAWPPGYKDRALRAIDDAIKSVRVILGVRDGDSFRGVDRDPDFYKRYKDHPRLHAVLQDLREAREELRAAKSDFGGLRERALEDIDIAVGDILTLLRHNKR